MVPLSNARVPVIDGNLTLALKKLKKQLALSGTIFQMKRHAFHMKPGEARRMKSKRAQKRVRKNIAKAAQREAARMAQGIR